MLSFYGFAVAVGRQRAIHTEDSGFASSTLGQHISTFRGYRILFSIRNPYINRFTDHFSICLFVYMQIISHDTLRQSWFSRSHVKNGRQMAES
jgi:hypothetical protein